MSNRAWVTLATNDSYGLGALVLAHSLRRAGSSYPSVVLITPAVTDAMRERLSAVFAEVITVDVLDSRDATHLALLQRPELGITFTKIHCWSLTQYEKCVFLDADTMVIQNCDELFEREELSAAPDVGWPDCFNSGVFVFTPSADTYSRLITFAQERGSFDGGDQGLLNAFFSDWAHGDINKHLPFLYNVTSAAFYSYLPALKHFGQNMKIIHFIGAAKPWLQQFNWESRTVDAPEHLRELLQQWWDLFVGQVHSQLNVTMTGVAGNLARVVPGAIGYQREALDELTRRQGWEAGNIDYMGADSFENIWAKISQTLNQPKQPSPPRKEPSPPKQPEVVKVAEPEEKPTAAPAPAPVQVPAAVEAPVPAPVAPVEAPTPVAPSEEALAPGEAPTPQEALKPVEVPAPITPAPVEAVAPVVAPAPVAPAVVEAKPVEVPTAPAPVAAAPETTAAPETPKPAVVKKTEPTVPPTPPATPKSTPEDSTPGTPESMPKLESQAETPKVAEPTPATPVSPVPATEAPASPAASVPTKPETTPEKPLESSSATAASTDSPPLANTPSKEEAPAVPAAKSEERRKPAGKLQLLPPAAGDPLPTPDSELEDAASLAQSIIASELSTTVTSPSPSADVTSPPPLEEKRLSVEEPKVPTPPVSLAQIGVKPKAKATTAALIESSVSEKADAAPSAPATPGTPATPSEPSTPTEAPKKKLVKKAVKKEGGSTGDANTPVPPPRKKEKKPKEK